MSDLSRERIKELRSKPSPGGWMGVDEAFALLGMAEQLLTLKSALGADAQTTTGFGGAMERRPDWTQFHPALHADKGRTEHARPLWTDDEDRIKREAAALALREFARGAYQVDSREHQYYLRRADQLEQGG